ncbi:MAG: hypothetical protein ICV68_02735 [Pyrinomonadaceae bacterium]|nr:hypothetical protein [Pyrinomonadaceae bacterium]
MLQNGESPIVVSSCATRTVALFAEHYELQTFLSLVFNSLAETRRLQLHLTRCV